MKCQTIVEPLSNGLYRHTCPVCGFSDDTITTPTYHRYCGTPPTGRRTPKPPPPPSVGTEFLKLTKQLGVEPKSGCSCAALARRMDELGVNGCKEKRSGLLVKLQANYDLYNFADKLKAAANAVASGLAWRIDRRKPMESLLDLAIERASHQYSEE